MRARIVSVFALAVASCVAISLYRDADAQAPPLLRSPSFPPHPADIVNIDGGLSIPVGQSIEVVLFAVPGNRWLVVNDLCIVGPTSPGTKLVERTSAGDLVKVGPTAVARWQFDRIIRQSSIGYSFRPGSSVVLKLDGTNSNQSDGIWNLVGYLAN
ncbi:MAG: hypothetical protein IPH13_06060 [Planctomycetes bacterium]|nr:hypothetical protein [Planctomycetota bacterium]